MQNPFFFLFATLAISSAAYVVFSRRPIHGVLSLVITMFSLSGLFVLLGAHFLAMIQILLYAGAILVLFLFILMLIGIEGSDRDWEGRARAKQVIKAVVVAAFLAEFLIFSQAFSHSANQPTLVGTVEQIGKVIFSEHLLAFELVSLILSVGIVGVIHLSKKEGLD